MSEINKKSLEHLAELARIELGEKEEKKLVEDLTKILDYFKELNEVDTSGVEPLTGGTSLVNVAREDTINRTDDTGKGRGAFPESEGDHEGRYLKIPPIFGE